MLVLDCPTEYTTRYDAMDDVFFPTIEPQLHRQLSAVLKTIAGAKIIMQDTASKIATDTAEISVGKSKANPIGKMIPCFIPSPIGKKRKRDHQ